MNAWRVEKYLEPLTPERRAHSIEVARKVAAEAGRLPAEVHEDVCVAGLLHDVGYGHPETGLHALDGARFLARCGLSPVICHLVAHHSASTVEAQERGLDLTAYDAFAVEADLSAAHQLLWWADMTTGPTGATVTVEERLDEIAGRYGPEAVVTRFIERARLMLLAAGQSPAGSIRVPV